MTHNVSGSHFFHSASTLDILYGHSGRDGETTPHESHRVVCTGVHLMKEKAHPPGPRTSERPPERKSRC